MTDDQVRIARTEAVAEDAGEDAVGARGRISAIGWFEWGKTVDF